ncbi:hypothetical protein ASE17_05410 [Phenylobacterium sp. Root77]|jgi:hypothetical protein|uniref:hypothetical protein n=1 Tax=unclassified Phenylobacterium TaxID=2640670 RepID=UPI0006F1ED70|nr:MULTISPECIES: hypothetical protein [unclassified Phenylobacterium]KQW66502.1 hypothetical protein ASC73_19215 [Phenylobacterium sp. Root1277]KQW89008.1 hypothetical protein ASC79_20120 [Phenylobacterium sp. Root1290]KRC42136.1 hypothetical protein ASE17_05410 [Phenylobacterium sp. Root77]
MRALLLALATVSSLAAAAPSLAQTLKVNQNLSIDVTGFSGDPKILPDMVTNIEALNGGRVAAITYDNVAGAPGYSAIVLKGEEVRFWRLDNPTSQAVELIGASVPAWMLTWRNQRRASAVKAAKVSLADAIRTAEASEKGAPAVVAGIARSASNPTSEVQAYMVGLLKDGRLKRVAVDTRSGSPIENPEALEW